jgi:flavin reductase (DIM6/NTAB) family NADH-FMN oxidoreductase RutF
MNASPIGERFRQGMRRLAAGVTIVTTSDDGQRAGLTATALCSLSVAPPQLLVCVNREAEAHDLIDRGGRFCVNLLASGHRALAGRFAGADGTEGEARFAKGRWIELATGAPALQDALACFDCEVAERVRASTHTIFIGRVVDVVVHKRGRPLVYAAGEYAALAALAVGPARRARRASDPTPRGGRARR